MVKMWVFHTIDYVVLSLMDINIQPLFLQNKRKLCRAKANQVWIVLFSCVLPPKIKYSKTKFWVYALYLE